MIRGMKKRIGYLGAAVVLAVVVAVASLSFCGVLGSPSSSSAVGVLWLAEREGPDGTPEEIMHRADLAVYKAKLEGRNRLETARFGEGESRDIVNSTDEVRGRQCDYRVESIGKRDSPPSAVTLAG